MSREGAFLMILSAAIAAASQILLKKSTKKKHSNFWQEYINSNVLLSYMLLFLTMGMNILAYRTVDYKYGPVLNASSYIFILVFGSVFLGEKITSKKVYGNIMVIIGIIIYSVL